MPEGDTVHKIANALRPELEGARLVRLWLRDRGDVRSLHGVAIEEVVAVGKHLLVALGSRHVLHVHLGMHGKWFRDSGGENPRARAPVLRLATERASFACVRAPVHELLRRGDLAAHPVLSRLGPDLLGTELRLAEVVARARRSEATSAADLLLDQRVACGAGNVYKSEVLFLEGVDPWTPPQALDDARVAALFARAHALMQANLGGWKRTTVRAMRPGERWPDAAPRLFVYGRAGERCLRCGAEVAARRQGDAARTTYWCARCQPRDQYAIDARYAPRGSVPERNAARARPSARGRRPRSAARDPLPDPRGTT
jgi:endonuclease-8